MSTGFSKLGLEWHKIASLGTPVRIKHAILRMFFKNI